MAAASSAGSPTRPKGSTSVIADLAASGSSSTLGVAISPGITTLQRMP
jgi:hypothetical protein